MNMNKTAKKIWDIATTALVVLVVILATLLVGARFIGLTPFTVLSGSMEPTYHVGSLIYVKKVDPYTLEAGDVITYSISEEMVATHRIVEVIPDEEDPEVIRFKTKGDANEAEDGSLVYYENVQGTPIFTIPYLGYIANYIQNPPGTYFAIDISPEDLKNGVLKDSITIKNVPIGSYTVTEDTNWPWRYEADSMTVITKTVKPSDNTFSFANTRKNPYWLSGDCYCKNWWETKTSIKKESDDEEA